MAQASGMKDEVERAQRMVRQLDGASQHLLERFLREVEYDLRYRPDDRARYVSI